MAEWVGFFWYTQGMNSPFLHLGCGVSNWVEVGPTHILAADQGALWDIYWQKRGRDRKQENGKSETNNWHIVRYFNQKGYNNNCSVFVLSPILSIPKKFFFHNYFQPSKIVYLFFFLNRPKFYIHKCDWIIYTWRMSSGFNNGRNDTFHIEIYNAHWVLN